jgi:hypothetical protein
MMDDVPAKFPERVQDPAVWFPTRAVAVPRVREPGNIPGFREASRHGTIPLSSHPNSKRRAVRHNSNPPPRAFEPETGVMSQRKIPQDAFEFYFSLGPERSYEQVAGRYGVTKRAVTKLALLCLTASWRFLGGTPCCQGLLRPWGDPRIGNPHA